MQDIIEEFANNLGKITGLPVQSGDIVLTWIETFSGLPPNAFMKPYYASKTNRNYVSIASAFIRKTKTRPPPELMSKVVQYVTAEVLMLWIKTFSELPPTEFMNEYYKHYNSSYYIDIVSKFIRKTKTRPPPELMSKLVNQIRLINSKFIITWIETFSELPPADIMRPYYANKHDYLDIVLSFILKTRSKPPRELISKMCDWSQLRDFNQLREIILSWIEIFSELPPNEFFRQCYDTHHMNINFTFIALKFIQKTKTRPSQELMQIVAMTISFLSDNFVSELYEAWIEIFSELPPEIILNHTKRNLILEKTVFQNIK